MLEFFLGGDNKDALKNTIFKTRMARSHNWSIALERRTKEYFG